jgi:DnaD/phage-associated family protein
VRGIQLQLQAEPEAVEIPFAFINDFMLKCPPVYALIYIYCLKQCTLGRDVTSREVAQLFNILETDVNNAWGYWEKEGLIKSGGSGENARLTFLPVPDGTPPAPPVDNVVRVSGRPQYTVEELSVYRKQSKDIAALFAHAEKALGKLLTYNDMNVLFGFYDWLRMPVDVISYLLTYCADNNHRDMRYIEKAALDWTENEIDDIEKALTYVKTFDANYREVLRQMGQLSGYPTPSQRKYMDKWMCEYEMPTEVILEACDKAALQIGKPKFSYVDKMLAGWHKKGIKSVKDVIADAEEFNRKKEQGANTAPVGAAPRRKNRFVNFKQRDWDQDKLEKMEREYLAQSLKG